MKISKSANDFLKFTNDDFTSRLDDMLEIIDQQKTIVEALETEVDEMQIMLKDPAALLCEIIEKADVKLLIQLKKLIDAELGILK